LAGHSARVRIELEKRSHPCEAAVAYWLKHRARPPVRTIGIDEVSRRKGQVYMTVVYDLERRRVLWVGDDRTDEAVRPFFEEMGKRRCQMLRVVCMDMWAPCAKLVGEHAVNAQILFDRFHIVKHLHNAVDASRRELWRQLTSKTDLENAMFSRRARFERQGISHNHVAKHSPGNGRPLAGRQCGDPAHYKVIRCNLIGESDLPQPGSCAEDHEMLD
jgi:transposase